MIDYMIIMIAFLITFPFVPTFIMYKTGKKLVHHKWRAIHIAINWTTVLYILSTIVLLKNMFERQFIGIVFGMMILMLTIIIIWQWKTKTEVLFTKAVKILWRLCFLIFLFTYCALIVYGIVARIIF